MPLDFYDWYILLNKYLSKNVKAMLKQADNYFKVISVKN